MVFSVATIVLQPVKLVFSLQFSREFNAKGGLFVRKGHLLAAKGHLLSRKGHLLSRKGHPLKTCQPYVNLCQPQKGCKPFVHRRFDNLTTFTTKFPIWISWIPRKSYSLAPCSFPLAPLILYTDFIQILFTKDFSTLQFEFFSSFSWFSHFLYLLLQPRMLTNSPIFNNNN